MTLQFSVEVTKTLRSVEHRQSLRIGSDEDLTIRPIGPLIIAFAFNKLTILLHRAHESWTVDTLLLLEGLEGVSDLLIGLRDEMEQVTRRRLLRRYRKKSIFSSGRRARFNDDVCWPVRKGKLLRWKVDRCCCNSSRQQRVTIHYIIKVQLEMI